MPKNEKQKQKLVRLLEILTKRTDEDHGIDMAEIISALAAYGIAAERKSIYDDLECLTEMGFEVLKMTETRPPRYALVGRVFERAELKMLVDAIEAAKFIPQDKCREIVKKLESFAGPSGARELSRRVYVDDRAENRTVFYTVDTVHSAINLSKKISFLYFGYSKDKKKIYHKGGEPYRVSPLCLVWNDENYYLIGYDEMSGSVKNFRVDKMERVTQLGEMRSDAALCERTDPSVYTRRVFGMYGGREELVTLECADFLSGVIIDRFGKNVLLEHTEDGFRVRQRITVSPNFFAWVAGFGRDMRIVSPAAVADEFCAHVGAALEQYKNK